MKIFNKLKGSSIFKTAFVGMASLVAAAAYAESSDPTVQAVREHFVGTSNNLMMAVMLIAAIAGVAYVAMGLFSLKAASDSAGQSNQNLQKGITKIIIGGLLIAIPFLIKLSTSVVQPDVDADALVIPSGSDSQTEGTGTIN